MWMAESAAHAIWAELDKSASNSDAIRLLARHLQAAYDAGKEDQANAQRQPQSAAVRGYHALEDMRPENAGI